MDPLDGLAGAVTAVTGFEKGSGKTTFLNYLLPHVRRSGPVALFTIGVDGSLKSHELGLSTPEIHVEAGDVIMTTRAFARAASARFEVLETVPGRTALGRLFLGRAVRGGNVTLVGSEHFSAIADAIQMVRAWFPSVLVDGAVNRMTQVGALGDVRFAFTARVNPFNLSRTAARMKVLASLASLPCQRDPEDGCLLLEGPLTSDLLKALPAETKAFSVEDFTKVFLEPDELKRAMDRYAITVRRVLDLLCLAVTLRDVKRDAFLAAVGPLAGTKVLFNPYEVGP